MNKYLLYILVGLIAGSCLRDKGDEKYVIFAGEIVNPTSDQVVLFKGEEALDSVKLDADNRFVFKLDSVSEGLHHFYHNPELQYVYLENGDSLQVRLNTSDFDESLVFSGKGEEINNFMLEMFLLREEEEFLINSMYELEPEEFRLKIDSLKNNKLALLEQTNTEFEISPKAFDLAKSFIVYSSNISMEAYPFYHRRRSGEPAIHQLPDSFYGYRNEVNYNDEDLTYLRPYYNFMKFHLGNLAYTMCKSNCEDIEKASRHLHFNEHKLKLIDSLITQKELRDNLFRNVAIDYLLKHDTEEHNKIFIKDFKRLSHNNVHNEEINTLYEGIINMQPTKTLPDFTLYTYNGDEVKLNDLENKGPVVFYFWSGSEPGHFKNITKRVTELKQEHPEYHFIGINLRTDHSKWKGMVDTNKLEHSEQFWTNNYEKAVQTLIIYNPNKTIIARNGVIVDAFANIYNPF
ncbi:TlpA family protein disulfide reductase [Muriicola sp.]|uniref:TlpA family protein disulfide reductase n=1 Tax=Muriicola sp. TaxID=2020856 RepID=UPI003C7850D9